MKAKYAQCTFHGKAGDSVVWVREDDLCDVGVRGKRVPMVYTLSPDAKVYSGSGHKLEETGSVRVELDKPTLAECLEFPDPDVIWARGDYLERKTRALDLGRSIHRQIELEINEG